MQVNRLNIAFWRHCMRPLDSYPFFKCGDEIELKALTRQTLNDNTALSLWFDKLLNRPNGYYSELITKKEDSAVNKHLYYVSQILISTVLKNDTGLRGGISPIILSSPSSLGNQNKKCKFDDISIPSSVKYIDVNEDCFDVNSLVYYRTAPDDYIIPFDNLTDKLKLSDDKITTVDTISRNIIHNFIRKNTNMTSADCFPFAIDFFIRQDSMLPFESHFPGRGLGVHFLPFLLFSKQREIFQNYFVGLFSEIKKKYGSNAKLEVGSCGQTSFHGLDRSLINLINNNFALLYTNSSPQVIKHIDLDVNDDYKKFPVRTIPEWDYSINQIILNKNITSDDVPEIKGKIGNWAIIKSSLNIPWWSKYRKKPEVCLVDKKFVKRINNLLQEYPSVIVQELITDSVDKNGNFGELRLYYMVMS